MKQDKSKWIAFFTQQVATEKKRFVPDIKTIKIKQVQSISL